MDIEGLPATYVSETTQDENGTWIITNTYQNDGYFKAHSLSLRGDIGVNLFLDLTEEEQSSANTNI